MDDEIAPDSNLLQRVNDWLRAAVLLIGYGLAAVSILTIVLTFPLKYTHHIILPGLVPILGAPFAVVFVLIQYAIAAGLRSARGALLVTLLFPVGAGLGWIGMNWLLGYRDVNVEGFTAARHILASGACASGIALGFALINGWALPPES